MARKRMVTRTITMTTVEVMCVDVETKEIVNRQYEVSGSYVYQPDKLLKIVKLEHETPTFKVVDLQNSYEQEVVYGMDETDFIKYAQVITR